MPPPTRARAFAWISTAAATGAIVMAMELTAFRLYAPYFGNSIYVWGSMISVVMLALAVGYSMGGWIADRAKSDSALYWVVFASGLYQLAIVFTWHALLLRIWTWGDFSGPVTATLVIFVPPMAALAMTSPFVIRLLARAGHVGIAVGRVFALSTAGSIAGVLGTSFWLVPRLGTRVTMELLCAVSILIGVAGLLARTKLALLLALPLALLLLTHAPIRPPTMLYGGESVYNRIRVEESDGLRALYLNNPLYFQTMQKVGESRFGFYLDQFALGPMIVPAKNLLVLGMGAGESIRVTRSVDPAIEVDAVEIDPEVVRVAGVYFQLPQNDPRLHVHVADARPWLAIQKQRWNLVHVDLFQSGPWVPFYLTTVEFFELVKAHVSEDGMLMVNVLDRGDKKELLDAMGATLRQVFPSVQQLTSERGNYILFAFAGKRELADTVAQLRHAPGQPWAQTLAQKAAAEMVEVRPREGAIVFRDDKAPIEGMTRRMLAEAKD